MYKLMNMLIRERLNKRLLEEKGPSSLSNTQPKPSAAASTMKQYTIDGKKGNPFGTCVWYNLITYFNNDEWGRLIITS